MIRSLVKSIRNADSGTLLAEFVLIILGIFLGLQADAWFEERQTRESLDRYLTRLNEDVGQMLEFYKQGEENYTRSSDSALQSLRALENCSLSGQQQENFERTLVTHQWLSPYLVKRSTYDEMIAAGALAHIRNPGLKDALTELYARLESGESALGYFRADLGRSSQILWERVRFTYDEAGEPTIAQYNFEAMCGDFEVHNAMAEIVDSKHDWANGARFMTEALERAASELAKELSP